MRNSGFTIPVLKFKRMLPETPDSDAVPARADPPCNRFQGLLDFIRRIVHSSGLRGRSHCSIQGPRKGDAPVKSYHLATATILCCLVCQPANSQWEECEFGHTATFRMDHAPYPHHSRDNGYTMEEMYHPPRDGHYVYRFDPEFYPRDPHYIDNTVALVIPRGYRVSKDVDLLFFFHGAYMDLATSLQLEDWALRKQIHDSGKNLIMVLPQGPYKAADIGGGKLEDPGGLRRLVIEVLEKLKQEGKTTSLKTGRIVLSGHSAGYRVMSFCLEHGGMENHIREVYLLDGCHDRFDRFALWAGRNRQARLLSIFTDGLAWQHVSMMLQMQELEVPVELVAEGKVTDEMLRRKRALLMFTNDTHHNTALRLGKYVRTSGFEER